MWKIRKIISTLTKYSSLTSPLWVLTWYIQIWSIYFISRSYWLILVKLYWPILQIQNNSIIRKRNSGPSCSKLTMSLVNLSLKLWSHGIYTNIFAEKTWVAFVFAYLQAILKAHVKFQKDQPKTVGGVKGTRYLLPIHFCNIRTQKMSKLKMQKKW